MRASAVPNGTYVPVVPVGHGAQRSATIASTSPGLRYGNQSSLAADVTFQPSGSINDIKSAARYDLRGYRGTGGSLPGRGFGNIGYLGNVYNDYPTLNNPYGYPYGVSPTVQAYYRGAPGECSVGQYGAGYGAVSPCGAGGCCGGQYSGPNYYRR